MCGRAAMTLQPAQVVMAADDGNSQLIIIVIKLFIKQEGVSFIICTALKRVRKNDSKHLFADGISKLCRLPPLPRYLKML